MDYESQVINTLNTNPEVSLESLNLSDLPVIEPSGVDPDIKRTF